MIVVRVELHSAIDGTRTELARMHICNIGGSSEIGNYEATTLRGRSTRDLDKAIRQRAGEVRNWPRLRKHVWGLVLCALMATGYHKDITDAGVMFKEGA